MSITDTNIRLSDLDATVRPPALAGSFYPAASLELQHQIESFLKSSVTNTKPPKAIIAPHAGYIYSGSTAAAAYASLKQVSRSIRRVVILGPAHRVYLDGMAIPTTSYFTTPLGQLKVDRAVLRSLRHLDYVQFMDEAHAEEHCIEIQLPFLQLSLHDFTIVPIVVGNASPEQVGTLLELVWGGEETLVVISTDLSHFLDYESALTRDAHTAELIEELAYAGLSPQKACGARPLGGLLKYAMKKNMTVLRLGLCNSGDTAGNHERVVGYGAWALYNNEIYSDRHKQILLKLAHKSIEHGMKNSAPLKVNSDQFPVDLRQPAACFVTLKIDEQLRGCIGQMEATQAIVQAVADSAFKAAFRDPRFKPLTEQEYANISLNISILSPQSEISFESEDDIIKQLQVHKNGLTIKSGRHQATFLPAVWENLPEANQFLAQLKRKAGISSEQKIEQAWIYRAESIY
ncbi:MAG: AmmeMemoRadiSam system protein B [Gammaproteobacteria bacterium]|nr:AmmeMemoRadiSam system protein B [Gammaproteobacteria bacterium]